jgi:hypothetical protein
MTPSGNLVKAIWFVLLASVVVFWVPTTIAISLMLAGVPQQALGFSNIVELPALYYPVVVGASVLISFVFYRSGRNRSALWTAITPVGINLLVFLILFALLQSFYTPSI